MRISPRPRACPGVLSARHGLLSVVVREGNGVHPITGTSTDDGTPPGPAGAGSELPSGVGSRGVDMGLHRPLRVGWRLEHLQPALRRGTAVHALHLDHGRRSQVRAFSQPRYKRTADLHSRELAGQDFLGSVARHLPPLPRPLTSRRSERMTVRVLTRACPAQGQPPPSRLPVRIGELVCQKRVRIYGSYTQALRQSFRRLLPAYFPSVLIFPFALSRRDCSFIGRGPVDAQGDRVVHRLWTGCGKCQPCSYTGVVSR